MYKTGLLLVLLSILLSGCGPVYRTTYYYSEPESLRSRECIVKCQNMRQKCEHWADQSYQQCLSRKSIERIATAAIGTYDRRERRAFVSGPSDNECMYERSAKYNVCLKDFNACFQLCGGVVDSIEECVANCG